MNIVILYNFNNLIFHVIFTENGTRSIKMDEHFYSSKQTPIRPDEVLVSVDVPITSKVRKQTNSMQKAYFLNVRNSEFSVAWNIIQVGKFKNLLVFIDCILR